MVGVNWGSCGWHESGWMVDQAVAGNWRPVMGTGFIPHPLDFMTVAFQVVRETCHRLGCVWGNFQSSVSCFLSATFL